MNVVSRKLVAVTAVMLALSIVACTPSATTTSTTDSPAKPAGSSDLLVDVATANQLNYRIEWQADLGLTRGQVIQTVTPLSPERVAVMESGNILTLLDARSGRTIWRKAIGSSSEIFTEPQLVDDAVVICSQARAYLLRAESGEMFRAIELAYLTTKTPVIQGGVLIAGTPAGLVFGQSINSGFVNWRYQLTGAVDAPVIWADGLVLATDVAGTLAVLTPQEGRIVWRRFKPPWDRISAVPESNSDTVFVACEDQKLYAFDRSGGELYWAYLTEDRLTTPPVALGIAVYQYAAKRGLVKLDAFDGREMWQAKTTGTPVQLTGNHLTVLDGTTARLVDDRDGAVIGEAAFDNADHVLFDAETNANVYLVNNDGRVMKLAPR